MGNKTLLKKEFAVNGSCIKNLKMGVQIEMLEKSRFLDDFLWMLQSGFGATAGCLWWNMKSKIRYRIGN